MIYLSQRCTVLVYAIQAYMLSHNTNQVKLQQKYFNLSNITKDYT